MTNIVMLVHNRYALTRQSLETLRLNTDPAKYNLTVIDDGSDDFRVVNYLKHLADSSAMQLVRFHRSTHVLGYLKNCGVEISRQMFGTGDYLYLSDNDVYFTPGWLEKMTSELWNNHNLGILGGQIHPFHRKVDPDTAEVIDGPSWMMRYDAWEGLFQEGYGGFGRPEEQPYASGTCQSEEYPFCQRLRTAGYYLSYCSPPVVLHCGLTTENGNKCVGYDERLAELVELRKRHMDMILV